MFLELYLDSTSKIIVKSKSSSYETCGQITFDKNRGKIKVNILTISFPSKRLRIKNQRPKKHLDKVVTYKSFQEQKVIILIDFSPKFQDYGELKHHPKKYVDKNLIEICRESEGIFKLQMLNNVKIFYLFHCVSNLSF